MVWYIMRMVAVVKMKVGAICGFVALSARLLAGEIAEPLSPELEQLIADVAAVPAPLGPDPHREPGLWGRKQAAVNQGCRMGTRIWPAVPALVRLAGHSVIQVSVAAATILASVKTEEHPRWKQIQAQLRSTPNAHAGFEYLIAGRDEGMQFYSNPRRKFSLQALRSIGPAAKPAAPTLVRFLESRAELDVPLWGDAAAALMAIDSVTYLPAIRSRFADPEEALAIRTGAAAALAGAKSADTETMAVLHRGLTNSYSQIRLAAARTLLILSVPLPEVQPTLTALLKHKLPSIRTGALQVLTDLGPRAAPLRSEITPLLDDSAAPVREAAQTALEMLAAPNTANGEKLKDN
jgi:hypothetical protein